MVSKGIVIRYRGLLDQGNQMKLLEIHKDHHQSHA